MHKVTSEAGEIRNVSFLVWRPSTGDKDAGQQIPVSHDSTSGVQQLEDRDNY